MKNIKYLLSAVLITFAAFSFAQGDLISASDFVKLMKSDKNLIIIDASKAESYAKLHVKNAVNIPHATLYQEGDIEALILSADKLAEIFASKGVSNTSNIVVYDGGSQKYSSRVCWILKYMGAENVKVLHKDMNNFRKARVPVTKMPSKAKKASFTPNINKAIYADISEVVSGKVKLVDARDDKEFAGIADNSNGHLPGAVHINYKDVLNDDNSFKSKEEITAIFKAHGLSESTPIIGYCRTSVRATVLYVAAKNILGWDNFKVYDGAYVEWVAKGKKIETKAGVSVSKKIASASGGC